jgi:hypothetical protein
MPRASSASKRPDVIFPLFQLNSAEIQGVILGQKPSYVAVANRSRYTTVAPSKDAGLGMGFVKAIGSILCGHVQSFATNAQGTVGEAVVISASTNPPHHLSWDERDPADIVFGGFDGEKPTYHLALLHLLACILDPLHALHETSEEVVERWEVLLQTMHMIYPRHAHSPSWDLRTQVQSAFAHPLVIPRIEALADALYFSLRNYQFSPQGKHTKRAVRVVSYNVVPATEILGRRGNGTLLLITPMLSANPSVVGAAAGPPVRCPNCQHDNIPSDEFCAECGFHLLSPPPMGITPASAPSARGNPLPFLQNYIYIKEVGQGGMGTVVQMRDPLLDRFVAVKYLTDLSYAGAFKSEARHLAALRHPSIPTVYAYDEGRGYPPYIVMQFIEGETLDEYLQRTGIPVDPSDPAGLRRLPVGKVIQLGLILCDVLIYLHGQEPPIIFRDLKPENIMVTPRGELYLIDFGIARGATGSNDTVALGSLGYAAPEQCGQNPRSTPRSDLYALGAVLHHLITGIDPSSRPFFFEPFLSPPHSVPAPVELERLVLSLVERNADKRPALAILVQAELQGIQRLVRF